MAAGRVHDRITLWGLPWVGVLSWGISRNSTTTLIVCVGYLVGGLILGPDLDIYSRHYQRWGWFRWMWLPYQKTIPHRSFWSHGFLVGTTVRLLYLAGWGLLLGTVLLLLGSGLAAGQAWGTLFQQQAERYWSQGLDWVQRYWVQGGWLYLGLELGAMSHSVVDWLTSVWKRSRRKPRKK